jgi:hypothetical protein
VLTAVVCMSVRVGVRAWGGRGVPLLRPSPATACPRDPPGSLPSFAVAAAVLPQPPAAVLPQPPAAVRLRYLVPCHGPHAGWHWNISGFSSSASFAFASFPASDSSEPSSLSMVVSGSVGSAASSAAAGQRGQAAYAAGVEAGDVARVEVSTLRTLSKYARASAVCGPVQRLDGLSTKKRRADMPAGTACAPLELLPPRGAGEAEAGHPASPLLDCSPVLTPTTSPELSAAAAKVPAAASASRLGGPNSKNAVTV